MPRAAIPSPVAAQTAGPRARLSGIPAATGRMAVAAGAEDHGRCLLPPARAAATRRKCHSNPAVISPSTARPASSSVVVAAVVVAGTARVALVAEGATSVHVEPREGESFDQFLRRFKTSMDKSGILREYKRKRYFKSNGELQREKAKAAARRRTKRLRGPRPLRPAR
jgi:small subunit ribosomal protein S21